MRNKCWLLFKTYFRWYGMLSNTSTTKFMVRWHIFHISMWETKWLFEIRHQINNQAFSNVGRNFTLIVSVSWSLSCLHWSGNKYSFNFLTYNEDESVCSINKNIMVFISLPEFAYIEWKQSLNNFVLPTFR